jgi:hypothetical protein
VTETEARAAALYHAAAQERGPTWDQLGAVTRSVWLERAQATGNDDLFDDSNDEFFD